VSLWHDNRIDVRTVKRLSRYLLTIVAGAATAILAPVVLHRSDVGSSDAKDQRDAAFRDGLFIARLDAENGRRLHLMSGRWNTDADRRLFVAAYVEAYREMRGDAAAEQMEFSQLAGKRGYRDGLADGLQHRYQFRPFQPNATGNYRRANRGYSNGSGDLNQYKQAYREAYCNAYQLAFYGAPQEIRVATVLRRRAPE